MPFVCWCKSPIDVRSISFSNISPRRVRQTICRRFLPCKLNRNISLCLYPSKWRNSFSFSSTTAEWALKRDTISNGFKLSISISNNSQTRSFSVRTSFVMSASSVEIKWIRLKSRVGGLSRGYWHNWSTTSWACSKRWLPPVKRRWMRRQWQTLHRHSWFKSTNRSCSAV